MELGGNIRLLENCMQSPSPALRGSVINMLREMREEYNVLSVKADQGD